MFRVIKTDANRLDVQMSGKLDEAGMKAALDDLESKSEGIINGVMLYEVIDFHIPSLGAIAIEFSRLPSLFGLMTRFNRAAVLTDQAWLRKVAALEGALFPGLKIKAFSKDQREQAEVWLES